MNFEKKDVIDDITNITGMASLINSDDIDVDMLELEQRILKTKINTNTHEDFDNIKNNLNNMDFTTPAHSFYGGYRNSDENQNDGVQFNSRMFGNDNQKDRGQNDRSQYDQRSEYAPTHADSMSIADNNYQNNNHYYQGADYNYQGNNYQGNDFTTDEQKKQQIIDNAMPKFINSNFDFKEEDEKEKKISMLEQIDSLRDTLMEDRINITSVQKVDINSSMEDIETVLNWLTIKSDRNRFSVLGEEFILMACKGLEKIFDGNRSFLGAKPDLTGWSDTARTKLVRSRYHTSSIVANFINKNNISPTLRLTLELVPNAILYASRKKNDKTFDNNAYDDAMNNLL